MLDGLKLAGLEDATASQHAPCDACELVGERDGKHVAVQRLDILPRMVRSPVENCLGTRPSQAAKSRPLENASPVPIAATIALEMIGPMPGTLTNRSQPASWRARAVISPDK